MLFNFDVFSFPELITEISPLKERSDGVKRAKVINIVDRQHLEQVRQGVSEWNRWRIQNPEIAIDLSEANLGGIDLSRANLSETDLPCSGIDPILGH
jgi:hypothetical protein